MSKLFGAYSNVSWKSRQTMDTQVQTEEQKVKSYWLQLKAKYSWLQLKEEYGRWIEKRRQKGRPDPFNRMSALRFFEEDCLKYKKEPPAPLPGEKELESTRKTFAEREKQLCHRLLSDCGLKADQSVLNELINDAVYKEGLTHFMIQDWLESQGNRPVYAKTKELYQLVLQQKTAGAV